MITATATLGGSISATAVLRSTQVGSCPDATVENTDGSYSDTVESGGNLELPNITFTDSDGSTSSVPSVQDITATPCAVAPSVSISLDDDTPYFNQQIEITATPTGITTPSYRFWVDNGTDEEIIYSGSNATVNWNVLLAGSVTITVECVDSSDTSKKVYNSTTISIEGIIFKMRTWDGGTTNRDQVSIPIPSSASVNCVVKWILEDGTLDGTDTITTYNDAAWTHTFPDEGDVYVQITGTMTQVSDTTDLSAKLLEVIQWNGVEIQIGDWLTSGNIRRISASDAPIFTLSGRGRNFCKSSNLIEANLNAWNGSALTDLFQFMELTDVQLTGLETFMATLGGGSLFRMFRSVPSQDFYLRNIPWVNVTNASSLIDFTSTTLEDAEATITAIRAADPGAMIVGLGNSRINAGSQADTDLTWLAGQGYTINYGGYA